MSPRAPAWRVSLHSSSGAQADVWNSNHGAGRGSWRLLPWALAPGDPEGMMSSPHSDLRPCCPSEARCVGRAQGHPHGHWVPGNGCGAVAPSPLVVTAGPWVRLGPEFP